MAFNRARVGGSGFTAFTFGGKPIAFAQQVAYTAPAPVGAGPVAIHPMDEPYPVQVITPAAAGMGSIVLNLYELYNEKVWERLGASVGYGRTVGSSSFRDTSINHGDSIFFGAVDIVDVFIRVAEAPPGTIDIVKIIRPPKIAGQAGKAYTEEFHNCVVTNVTDTETIEVGTMEVLKQVTVGFTHITRSGKGSKAWDYRNNNHPS